MTEPVCNLPAISDACDQMVFEDYGFSSYCRATCTVGVTLLRWRAERGAHGRDAGWGCARRCSVAAAPFLVGQLTLDKDALSVVVVVDVGFSFLTAVVVLDGFPVHGTAKRCAK